MSAVFTKAVRYWVTATCKSPLRTGAADSSVESVLCDWTGQPFVQGSSLAGAMHAWLLSHDEKVAKVLFGSQQIGGKLMVSDGYFARDAVQQIRPRLRLNGAAGTADEGGKFDVAQIASGSKLTFTLTLLEQENDDFAASVERMLAALHAGEIRLGAQKLNGFGRVTLSVQRRLYRMKEDADRRAWLEGREDGTPWQIPELAVPQDIVFTVKGMADSLLVKASATERRGKKEVTVALRENGKPVLPGSSVKGAVRAQVERIAQRLALAPQVTENMFGRRAQDGDNGICGQVRFEDVCLSDKKAEISRIRINKFTGGVMRKGLFTEEPLCSEVTFRIAVPQEQDRMCGLLLYALRDLGLGLYGFGSGGAIGRGELRGCCVEAQTPQGERAVLRFDENRQAMIEDAQGLFARWLTQVKEGET